MTQPFIYKRTNHFIECLNNLTCNYEVPIDIVNAVRDVLYHNHMELTEPAQVRIALKQLGKADYYEQSGKIFTAITGIPTGISLSDDQRDIIVTHFRMANDNYNTALNNKGLNRRNFLNYNYTIVKLAQLSGISDANKLITIQLSTPGNLAEHDTIWMEICRLNKWPKNISLIELKELKDSFTHAIYCLNKWANNQEITLQKSWIEMINKSYFLGVIYY